MISKFLTESARIADAYMKIRGVEVSESTKNKNNGNLLKSLKGQLPIDGRGSKRTGSKLGVRKVMPFDKRDAKPCCADKVPLKKNEQFRKITNNWISKGGPHDGLANRWTVKAMDKRPMPFEKRDEKPTSLGRIKDVKDISKVSRVSLKKLGESTEGVEDATDVEIEEIDVGDGASDAVPCECCAEKDELLDTVLLVFEQIYDNLSDDDKETVDEVKDEIEAVLNGDNDEEDEEDDGEEDDDDGDEDEDEDYELTVNEAARAPSKGGAGRKTSKPTTTKGKTSKPTTTKGKTAKPKLTKEQLERKRQLKDAAIAAKKAGIPSEKIGSYRKYYTEYRKAGDGAVDAASKAAASAGIDFVKHNKILLGIVGITGVAAEEIIRRSSSSSGDTTTQTKGNKSDGPSPTDTTVTISGQQLDELGKKLTAAATTAATAAAAKGGTSATKLDPNDPSTRKALENLYDVELNRAYRTGTKSEPVSLLKGLLGVDVKDVGNIPDWFIKTLGGKTADMRELEYMKKTMGTDIDRLKEMAEADPDNKDLYYSKIRELMEVGQRKVADANVVAQTPAKQTQEPIQAAQEPTQTAQSTKTTEPSTKTVATVTPTSTEQSQPAQQKMAAEVASEPEKPTEKNVDDTENVATASSGTEADDEKTAVDTEENPSNPEKLPFDPNKQSSIEVYKRMMAADKADALAKDRAVRAKVNPRMRAGK